MVASQDTNDVKPERGCVGSSQTRGPLGQLVLNSRKFLQDLQRPVEDGLNVESESAQVEQEGDVLGDREVVRVAVGESREHVQGRLAAGVAHAVLVEVGKVLELLCDRFEDEIALGVFLHLAAIGDVDAELLAEQLDDILGQFLDLPGRVVASLPDPVEQDMTLVAVVDRGVVLRQREVVQVLPVP